MSSAITNASKVQRIESEVCLCLEPWFLGALFITGISLAILGSLALPARLHQLPWGFLKEIPLDQSSLMISIGAAATSFVIIKWMRQMPQPKVDLEQCVQNLKNKSEELKNHSEQKLYYYPQTNTIETKKGWWEPKGNHITLYRIDKSGYYAKTDQMLGKGIQKKAFLIKSLQDGSSDQVRTVEYNPPENDEMDIYDTLKGSSGTVRCLAINKNTKKKRSLILEYCSKGTLKTTKITDQRKLLILFEDYLRGLSDLHTKGYLHLDCHKGNLFIDDTDRGHLGDFGSSRTLTSLNTPEGFAKMMPDKERQFELAMAYDLLAPEIVLHIGYSTDSDQQLPRITGKADVWALGNVLAKLLKKDSSALQSIHSFQKQVQPRLKRFCPYLLKEDQYYSYFNMDYPPEPVDKLSLDFLIWKMLHPHPDLRFNAQEAADFIAKLLQKIPEGP